MSEIKIENRKGEIDDALKRGVDRLVCQLIEYCSFHSRNERENIFLINNILINTVGNIFKAASNDEKSLIKKVDTFINDLITWKNVAIKRFERVGYQTRVIDGKEVN